MSDDDKPARILSEPSPFRGAISLARSDGAMRFAPSAERNLEPILDVLREVLPQSGQVLEVASGTGQHATAFAGAFANLNWTPSDRDAEARHSIEARRIAANLGNLAAPLDLDVTQANWSRAIEGPLVAILAINMIHISPWSACTGLLDGASELLAPGGVVYLYGCWTRAGRHLSHSNVEFDRSLKLRNPDWGVRDSDALGEAAAARGLTLERVAEMPANNLSLILRRNIPTVTDIT